MVLSLEVAFNSLCLDPQCLLSEKLGKSHNPDEPLEVLAGVAYKRNPLLMGKSSQASVSKNTWYIMQCMKQKNKPSNGKEGKLSSWLWRSGWADSFKHPKKDWHSEDPWLLLLPPIFFPEYLTWEHIFVFAFSYQTFVQNCLLSHPFLAVCSTMIRSGKK